jgi:hypothetical protein
MLDKKSPDKPDEELGSAEIHTAENADPAAPLVDGTIEAQVPPEEARKQEYDSQSQFGSQSLYDSLSQSQYEAQSQEEPVPPQAQPSSQVQPQAQPSSQPSSQPSQSQSNSQSHSNSQSQDASSPSVSMSQLEVQRGGSDLDSVSHGSGAARSAVVGSGASDSARSAPVENTELENCAFFLSGTLVWYTDASWPAAQPALQPAAEQTAGPPEQRAGIAPSEASSGVSNPSIGATSGAVSFQSASSGYGVTAYLAQAQQASGAPPHQSGSAASGIKKKTVNRLTQDTTLYFTNAEEDRQQLTVKSHQQLPRSIRNLVMIRFKLEEIQSSIEILSETALLVRSGGDAKLSLAGSEEVGGIRTGDFVLTQKGEAEVLEVTYSAREVPVFKVTFQSPNDRAFVSLGNSELAVQIFGEVTFKPPPDFVKLLVFKTFNDFRRIFFESAELAPCRHALGEKGFSIDLSDQRLKLGLGKMVIDDMDLAEEVVGHLRGKRTKENDVQINGQTLFRNFVIVSVKMETLVRSLVLVNTPPTHKNPVKNEPGYFLNLYRHRETEPGSRKRRKTSG